MNVKHYYAVLSKVDNGVIAEFPDIEDITATGEDFAVTYRSAFYQLQTFYKKEGATGMGKPSTYSELRKRFAGSDHVILPIPIRA